MKFFCLVFFNLYLTISLTGKVLPIVHDYSSSKMVVLLIISS